MPGGSSRGQKGLGSNVRFWRSKVFQLCLTRVLRERDLKVRGEDTRIFGLCAPACDSRPAWCDKVCSEWFSAGRCTYPEMGPEVSAFSP
jgi:hypothetical protein